MGALVFIMICGSTVHFTIAYLSYQRQAARHSLTQNMIYRGHGRGHGRQGGQGEQGGKGQVMSEEELIKWIIQTDNENGDNLRQYMKMKKRQRKNKLKANEVKETKEVKEV